MHGYPVQVKEQAGVLQNGSVEHNDQVMPLALMKKVRTPYASDAVVRSFGLPVTNT